MNSGVRHSSPWSPAGLSVAGLFLARLLLCVPPALAVTHDVSVNTFFFDPQDITIAAGDSVRWNWVFGTHTVTEGANCTVHNPLFNSPSDNQHPVFIFQFNTPGVYDYFCELHCVTQGMFGSVTVTGQSGVAGAAAPASTAGLGMEPNPMRGAGVIRFTLPRAGLLRLEVLDAGGRLVRLFPAIQWGAGTHQAPFDGRDASGRKLPGGVYYLRGVTARERLGAAFIILS